MRWLIVLLGVAILAVVAAVVVVLPGDPPEKVSGKAAGTPSKTATPTPSASAFTDPCGTFDNVTRAPYAITGYWITPSTNHCTWRKQMQQVHAVGGDTVIRIGYGLQPRQTDGYGKILKEGELDPRYEPCEEDGVPCVKAAENDLKKLNPDSRIAETYVYRTDESYGDDVFRCQPMERRIRVGKQVFFRLIAPADGSDSASCDFAEQDREYHLILISAAPDDSLTELLGLGDQFQVKVFPALPLAPRDRDNSTRADPKHIGTLTTLTRRILQDYGVRFAGRESLGGVYQPFEVQMGRTLAKNPTLGVYAGQHDIVEQELPDKPILISPYLDARKRVAFGQTPKDVAEAFKALAKTGVGIIAPQDSRGTGKVGLFWPDERDQEVDERLRPIVGEATYGTAYHGSTRDYYREMAAAREQMIDADYDVELWANVEAFEPSGTEPCQPQGTRGKTDKKRLDAAVAMTGRYVSKIVSYMWSDYMTCGSPSLEDEITKDYARPIAVDAIRRGRDIQDGIEVRGFNLEHGTVTLTWEGGSKELSVDATGWYDDDPLDLPDRMKTAWVPFDWTQAAGGWVKVGVRSPDGLLTHEPLHVRIPT